MPRIDIEGFGMHYQSFGAGPEVVMLHGLSGDAAFWHPAVVSGLARSHRVTLVDLRGHGRSDMPPAGYTTRQMAADVADLLEGLAIERAHLIGHSYGGAVALHLAVIAPARAASLVLADARIRSLQPAQGVREWSFYRQIRERLAQEGIEIPEEDSDPDFGLMNELARSRVAGRLDKLRAQPFFVPFAMGSGRRAERWLKLIETTTAIRDFKDVAGLTPEAIRRVGQPTLAIYGALSHCLPTLSILMGLLRDCRSHVVEGAGHFLPLVRPEAFLEQVSRFLAEAGSRAAAPRDGAFAPAGGRPSRPHAGR